MATPAATRPSIMPVRTKRPAASAVAMVLEVGAESDPGAVLPAEDRVGAVVLEKRLAGVPVGPAVLFEVPAGKAIAEGVMLLVVLIIGTTGADVDEESGQLVNSGSQRVTVTVWKIVVVELVVPVMALASWAATTERPAAMKATRLVSCIFFPRQMDRYRAHVGGVGE